MAVITQFIFGQNKIYEFKTSNSMNRFRKIKNSLLDSEERAYVAGIVDGEGCITNERYPRIRIVNTDKSLMNWLKKKIPDGTLYLVRYNPHLNTKRQKFLWHFGVSKQKAVLKLLKEIGFYLIIKRRKAEIVINQIENQLNL